MLKEHHSSLPLYPNGDGSSRRSTGFTLIELLIVIAIIAILAAIIFPVFARAREMARRSSCASNMKQMGFALFQYTQDYDERVPNWVLGQGGNTAWEAVIQSYVKTGYIFDCPSNHKEFPDPLVVWPRYLAGCSDTNTLGNPVMRPEYLGNMNTTYATSSVTSDRLYSSKQGNGMFGSRGASGIKLSQVGFPSTTVWVYENWKNYGDQTVDQPVAGVATPSDPVNDYRHDHIYVGHLGRSNYLFADGHVKALQPKGTITPLNMWHRSNAVPTTGIDLSSYNAIMTNVNQGQARADAQ